MGVFFGAILRGFESASKRKMTEEEIDMLMNYDFSKEAEVEEDVGDQVEALSEEFHKIMRRHDNQLQALKIGSIHQ
jgi:hypothetical protein